MNPPDPTLTATILKQVYLIERDCGVLCRILGLYAARSVDVLHVDYAYAAQDFMKLQVSVCGSHCETQELIRVLLDKASTCIGVLAACEHPGIERVEA